MGRGLALRRLAVARFWHEGNSFSPVKTRLEDFKRREWCDEEPARAFYRGTATEVGAAVAFAEARADWDVTFLRCAAAPPGGPIENAAFETIRRELLQGLSARRWDAVYLSLHGAMSTPSRPAADLDLLREVRGAIGGAKLAASFDLHANLGAPLIELADLAVGYKTYPHTDMFATGEKALRLLDLAVAGAVRPTGALAKLPALLPSFNMRTTDGPMAEVAALARQWEWQPGVLDATVFGGFAYGDSPHAGASALVHTDGDHGLARRIAMELVGALALRREQFYVTLPAPEQGIAQALAGPGPAAVLDPSDNPLSGGIADTPFLFRALIDARPACSTVFAFFCDPATVAEAHRLGEGGNFAGTLGGRLTHVYGPPVPFTGQVARLTRGRFRNSGPMETGLAVDLGRTAVLAEGPLQVIVTETCQAPNDPAYFALHGIDLGATRLLLVKAKNHFRAAFGPLCAAIIEVDAPGPASPDLTRYPFRHVPRHFRPLSPGPSATLRSGG